MNKGRGCFLRAELRKKSWSPENELLKPLEQILINNWSELQKEFQIHVLDTVEGF